MYIDSKGNTKEASDMDDVYLMNALVKAKKVKKDSDDHDRAINNMKVIEDELAKRGLNE